MNKLHVARLRLTNQRIAGPKFAEPAELVSWLGAVQAQDYGMAKWAVGLRVAGATAGSVEAAIDSGSIIRTHVLRPTWHFVAVEDIRWMWQLTGPRIQKACAYGQRVYELDQKTISKSVDLIAKSLEGGNHLTRADLSTILEAKGIKTTTHQASHIMVQAEIDQIVCNGRRRGKQFTYALFDERVPQTRAFDREAALANLALRYFTSHGPAKLQDFVWWSGLTASEAKLALKLVESELHRETVADEIYWMPHSAQMSPPKTKSVALLPAFDEFAVSYKDRSASISTERMKDVVAGYAIFKPIVVVDGQVVGVWNRTLQRSADQIEYTFFDEFPLSLTAQLERAAKSYSSFQSK